MRQVAVDFGVEQDRAQHQPDGHVHRAHQRHIDGPVRHLRRGAGQVYAQLRAADRQGHANGQVAPARVGIVNIAVHMAGGRIAAVWNLLNGLPHQALGVIKQGGAGRFDRVEPVALDEFDIAFGPDTAGRNLGFHIAHHQIGDADIIAQQLPHRRVPVSLLIHLDRLEL